MKKTPSLFTTQLVLRQLVEEDREALFPIVQENNIFRYFPSRSAWSMDRVDRYISYQSSHWHGFGYGHWAVTLKTNGQFIGWCGLEFLPDTNETEVGYLLSEAFWGKGYATEAASASVRFGLVDIGLKEIIGLTHPDNIASQRVLEKSGLSFTGRAKYFGTEMFRFSTQVEGQG